MTVRMAVVFVPLVCLCAGAEDEGRYRIVIERARAAVSPALAAYVGVPPADLRVEVSLEDQRVVAKRILADSLARSEGERNENVLALWGKLRFASMPTGGDSLSASGLDRMHLPAFYDPLDRRIHVGMPQGGEEGGSRERGFEFRLVHEFQHAYRNADPRTTDRAQSAWTSGADEWIAWRCLQEGDATLVADAVASLGPLGEKSLDPVEFLAFLTRDAVSIARSAESLRATLEMPARYQFAAYAYGARFVSELLQAGGPEKVRAAFDDPPRSTEQVLHASKYLQKPRDEPRRCRGADLSGVVSLPGGVLASGDLGELDLVCMFESLLGRERSMAAAAGWDGCGYTLYALAGGYLLTLVSQWDSEADAAEFAVAWSDWAGRRDGTEYQVRVTGSEIGEGRTLQSKEGQVAVSRRLSQVVIADGAPTSIDPDDLVKCLWKGFPPP